MKVLLSYIPVWHAGYELFFEETISQVDSVLIIDPLWAMTISPDLAYLKKEIRALPVSQVQRIVASMYPQRKILILNDEMTKTGSLDQVTDIIAANEDVTREVTTQLFSTSQIQYSPVFLRWDKHSATEQKQPVSNEKISSEDFTKSLLQQTYSEAGKSSDWWRHIGAALIKNNQPVLLAHNTQLPNDQESYFVGDARSLFHKGEWIELTSAIHAEAGIIAQAAKLGIATEGLAMLATTFPCPPCAKLIAQSGINRLYFCEGYAMFDGETILQAAGVEIIKISVPADIQALQDSGSIIKKYPY